jgi:hypothetical protein
MSTTYWVLLQRVGLAVCCLRCLWDVHPLCACVCLVGAEQQGKRSCVCVLLKLQ